MVLLQGSWSGGGGGAGGVVIHPGISIANGPYAVTIGAGGAAQMCENKVETIKMERWIQQLLALPTTYSVSGGIGAAGQANGGTGGSGGGGHIVVMVAVPEHQIASNPGATEYGNAGGWSRLLWWWCWWCWFWRSRKSNCPGGMVDGLQLPSTFRDPDSTVGAPGPGGQGYWVAGGGGGGGKLSAKLVEEVEVVVVKRWCWW